MSTFCGRLREIPGISVDRFDGENVHSRAFFLSHCHQDHMQGLDVRFFQNLTTTNRFLYTSDVSYAILSRKYPFITLNVKELSLQSPSMVHLDDGTVLAVVTIPAGHCPGSVMFLFEGKNKRVLYTGDYRCGMKDFKKIKVFYDAIGGVQTIDSLYLDTTFLLKRFRSLPTRTDSIRALLKLIKSAITNNQIIFLKTSAYYGYEQCFKEVFNEFKMPVHVGGDSYEFYKSIPEMDGCVTQNPSLTRIHSNCGGYKKICQSSQDTFTVTISVYSWTQSDLQNGVLEFLGPSDVKLCYSTHASYEEGMEFVKFLRPKRVRICVEPKEQADRVELQGTIQDILEEARDEDDIPEYFDYKKMSPMKKRTSQFETRLCGNINKKVKEGFKTTNNLKTILKDTNNDLNQTNNTVPTLGINTSCNLTTLSVVTTTLCNNQSVGSQHEYIKTSTIITSPPTLKHDIKPVIDDSSQTDNTILLPDPSVKPVIDDSSQTDNTILLLDPSVKPVIDDSSQTDSTTPPDPLHDTSITYSVTSTSFNDQLEGSRDVLTTDDNPTESLEKVSKAEPSTSLCDDYFKRELLSILRVGLDEARLKQAKTENRQEVMDGFPGRRSSEIDPVQEVLSFRISPCRDIEDSEDSS